jgi:hypothetical protein
VFEKMLLVDSEELLILNSGSTGGQWYPRLKRVLTNKMTCNQYVVVVIKRCCQREMPNTVEPQLYIN